MKVLVAAATLGAYSFRGACAQEEEERNPAIQILGEYLLEMADRLECYFTIEDRPDAEGRLRWIPLIKEGFTPDVEVATIDALVTKLNGEIEDVKFVRSTKYPSVVHVIAKDLQVEGYVMDQKVTVQYTGMAADLPRHLGTLLNGKIGPPILVAIGEDIDVTTEVEVNVQDETVRDILTGAIPLNGAHGTLWKAYRWGTATPPEMRVLYYSADDGGEEGNPPE